MKRLLLLFTAISISYFANSQFKYQEYVDYHIEITEGMPMAEEGTFQFVVLKPKVDPAFTSEILYFIERERDDKHDRVIQISEFVELYIPSRKTISSKDFVPLTPYSK